MSTYILYEDKMRNGCCLVRYYMFKKHSFSMSVNYYCTTRASISKLYRSHNIEPNIEPIIGGRSGDSVRNSCLCFRNNIVFLLFFYTSTLIMFLTTVRIMFPPCVERRVPFFVPDKMKENRQVLCIRVSRCIPIHACLCMCIFCVHSASLRKKVTEAMIYRVY